MSKNHFNNYLKISQEKQLLDVKDINTPVEMASPITNAFYELLPKLPIGN